MEKNKQRSKRNKKVLAAAGALACVALLAGTYAWLQSEDSRTNKFTGVLSGNDVTITENWVSPESWTPGQEVVKEVGIINTGEYDEFIRVSFKEALALLKDVNVQESDTLPFLVPTFFDPIDPETGYYGFAIEISDNGALRNLSNATVKNNLDAFNSFLSAYGLEYKVVQNEKGVGYHLEYSDKEGVEKPAPNMTGWLIPVSQDTINNLKTKNNWTDVTIAGAPDGGYKKGDYTLVAIGSPIKDIPNPNKQGEIIHARDYKFYWTIKDPVTNETNYYQSAGVDSTTTNYNAADPAESTVTLGSAPKVAFISAEYNETEEVQWWASTNPANNAVGQLFVPWKLDAGQSDAGSYANQTFAEALKPWRVNSNVKVTSQNPTKTKAEIAIDFVNMSQEVPATGADTWYYNEADGFFYYCNIVKSGETTAQIIDKVKLENGAGNEYTKLHYNLDVRTEAIQAIGEAATDEWNVTGPLAALYNNIGNKQNP